MKRAATSSSRKGKARGQTKKSKPEKTYAMMYVFVKKHSLVDFLIFRLEEKSTYLLEQGWTLVKQPHLSLRHRTITPSRTLYTGRAFSPYGFVKLMWPKEVLEHLVTNTNLKLAAEDRKKTTTLELQKYFGHLLIIAILGLRRNEDLWRQKGICIDYPGKEHGIGVKRWPILHSHLSLNPSELHGILRKAFQHHLIPGTLLCVDEARIACKNKGCPYLSYNKQKRDKWAIESLALSDSSRYLYDFTDPTADDKPTAFQWLIICGKALAGQGKEYHLTSDKRFSSLAQAQKLQELGIDCTLCCKANSPTYLFKDCLGENLKQYNVHIAESDGIIAATYYQKKKLNLVSTWFTVKEKKKATREDRLPMLTHYDDTKRWTDQFDQLFAGYHYNHPHDDWKITLVLGWFGFAHTNAYILFGKVRGKVMDHYDFLMDVAKGYLTATK
jgi:hypothetical protein